MSAPTLDVPLGSRFARELPELAVPWRAVTPPAPRLLALDDDLAQEVGLDPAWLRSGAGLGLLTGTVVPEGSQPVAQAYSGHQFGGWSPRLGDGRALLLGELTDRSGRPRDLHLKGSGRTPFARGGDGLAAVGPMLREHVVSTAVHALGIPTARSLAVVATGGTVRRERVLPGAVLARVASSHLRVGSFQYARATGDLDLLRRLVDHAVDRHHPAAAAAERPALALLDAVVSAQAALVARWMLVGFVHGVMNTDNMTVSGETIDYGPCAFLDAYDPATVYSSIDTGGRYAYGNQPAVAQWDLARLAETLLPLIARDPEDATAVDQAVAEVTELVEVFADRYRAAWAEGVRAKLGLGADVEPAQAAELGESFLGLLHERRGDLTGAFRALGAAARGDDGPVRGFLPATPATGDWLARWRALGPEAARADAVNPVYVPRNHLVEEALEAATAGDLAPVRTLLEVVRRPFEEQPGRERYAAPAPDGTGDYVTYCGT
ncbi:protein adenylyltransferase SelO [Aquipuribacter sp. SD81]|uniref:protein adenylyltransferase SelO n=1 Tax=Aquipuribacter sp. SD81 TaxID=3127703 RepID=UPI0030179290